MTNGDTAPGSVGKLIYYTAVSLDGFIADDAHDLSWLFAHTAEPGGPNDYETFIATVGAIVMGRSTYDWVVRELAASDAAWPYQQPCWVITSRPGTPPSPGDDVRFTAAPAAQVPAAQVVAEMRAAAGDADLWCVGGGETAAWLHRAGLLDEIHLTVAPEILGSGRPLLPARAQLELLATDRNGPFTTARYRVLR